MTAPPEPGSRTLAWLLFAASIALLMLLSASSLELLGIPYEAPFGPIWAKLHPGSYLLGLAWFVALVSHGNPVGALIAQLRRNRLLTVYLVCMVLVFCWAIYRHGTSGAAYIIQTLWMPAVAAFTLELLGVRRHRQIMVLVMLIMAVNSVVAIGEYALKDRLLPITSDRSLEDFFRPWALLGHPLLNAKLTMTLLPLVTLLPWPRGLRFGLVLLMFTAALAFGGRSALLLGSLVYGTALLLHVANKTVRGGFTYLELTGGSLALLFGASVLAVVVATTGLGDRIFGNLVWDNSANVRAEVWHAFEYLNGADWWIGIAPAQIDKIAVAMGLDPKFEAIENFWIYMYLQFGAIGYLPFIVGLLCLIALMLRTSTPAMRAAVITYFVVASTANSLATKSMSLTLLTLLSIGSVALVRSVRPARPALAATRREPAASRFGTAGLQGAR